jgi:hypothetical protein
MFRTIQLSNSPHLPYFGLRSSLTSSVILSNANGLPAVLVALATAAVKSSIYSRCSATADFGAEAGPWPGTKRSKSSC